MTFIYVNQDVQETLVNETSAIYADVTAGHLSVGRDRHPKAENIYAAIDYTVDK